LSGPALTCLMNPSRHSTPCTEENRDKSKWDFRSSAASVKLTVFWEVAPCNLIEVGRRFRDVYWLNHDTLMIETVSISEMSISFYQTTRLNIPEHSHLHGTPHWGQPGTRLGVETSSLACWVKVLALPLHHRARSGTVCDDLTPYSFRFTHFNFSYSCHRKIYCLGTVLCIVYSLYLALLLRISSVHMSDRKRGILTEGLWFYSVTSGKSRNTT
jgi:hypothetical protein